MKVFIIPVVEQVELYQPDTIEECHEMLCEKCVFYKYKLKGSACPFSLWLKDKPDMAKRCYPAVLSFQKRKP